MPSAPPFTLTDEQAAARDAFIAGDEMALEAGAGTGKTSTCKVLAHAASRATGMYLAYNRAMAEEARRKLPPNVDARTPHAHGYRWRSHTWGAARLTERLNSSRLPSRDAARLLTVNSPVRINADVVLPPARQIAVALATVKAFCHTSDMVIRAHHVPKRPGMEDPDSHRALAAAVLPIAQRAWEDWCTPSGRLKLDHDGYLKQWALTNPQLPCDFLLVDEAQDINGVVAGIVSAQTDVHRVVVGDSQQSIYGWRGATDFISQWAARPDVVHLFLSQSFRFGPAVAHWANMALTLLDAQLRITGTDSIPSRIARIDGLPDAVLCRSNARAVAEVIDCHKQGVKVHLAGRAGETKALAAACMELQEKGWTSHPELIAFSSWDDVTRYVDEAADGQDLAVAVKLIEEHGPEAIIAAIDQCVPSHRADIVVSTAHGAKGLEWGTVRVADDFKDPRDESGQPTPITPEELRLIYVTVTRAKAILDPAGVQHLASRYETHMLRERAKQQPVTV